MGRFLKCVAMMAYNNYVSLCSGIIFNASVHYYHALFEWLGLMNYDVTIGIGMRREL